jgi:hypothetical protein
VDAGNTAALLRAFGRNNVRNAQCHAAGGNLCRPFRLTSDAASAGPGAVKADEDIGRVPREQYGFAVPSVKVDETATELEPHRRNADDGHGET